MQLVDCKFCKALTGLDGAENIAEVDQAKVLHIGGNKPTETQLVELAREVQLLEQMQIWKILTDTVKSQAITLGIRDAKDFDQLMFAKAMLHIVGTQQSLLAIIKKEYNIHQEAQALASRVAQS